MTPDTLQTLLDLADADLPVADIASAVQLTPGRVYAILRKHRPSRRRTPRTLTSSLPAKVRALVKAGAKPSRAAFLCGVTRAYVYRIIKEAA